jgi:hypothetical protein
MRKVVDLLYPKQDKIAVFIMACLLLALVGFDAGARGLVASSFLGWFSSDPLRTSVVAAMLLAGFLAALSFPFVRRDFRAPAVVVLVVNAVALAIGNIAMAFESDSVVQLAVHLMFTAYFAGWLVAIRIYAREQLIEARDPQPSEALFAAALCMVLLAGSIGLLGMDWISAYSLAVAIAPGVHIAIRRRVLDPGLIQEER